MIGPALLVCLISFMDSAQAALPPEAQKLLDEVPGKRLSLSFVVSRAAQSSDSFQAAAADLLTAPTASLQAESLLAWRPFMKVQRLDDRREPTNPFSPGRIQNAQLSLGVSTAFQTGTQFQFEVSHGSFGLLFPNPAVGSIDYFETRTSLTLSQKLWNDAFGVATRATLESAEKVSRASDLRARMLIEDWAVGIIRLYYGAWLSQSQGRAARSALERKRRLQSAMDILVRRGTAEAPDRYQVEAALAASEVQWEQARTSLQDQWRQLVVALKLPAALSELDAFEIPVDLDQPLDEARRLCGSEASPSAAPESKALRQARLASEAADLDLQRARSRMKPDVDLNLSVFSNGIDAQGGNALSEGSRWVHPGYLAGVSLSMPIGFQAEKAQALQAIAQLQRAEAFGRQELDRARTDWIQYCVDLHRMDRAAESWKRAFSAQERRAEAEEKRFKIGRSGIFQVIQAGDDATQARLAWDSLEVERRINAWMILRQSEKMTKALGLPEGGVF